MLQFRLLAVVRLARRQEGRRDLHAAGRAKARVAALVRHQRAVADAGKHGQRRRQLVGVGELRDPLRGDEGGDLDAAQPGERQARHQLALRGGGDRVGLVLQPVARTDLVERAPRARSPTRYFP